MQPVIRPEIEMGCITSEPIDKLDRWADDLKNGLETEIKDLSAEIKPVGRDVRLAPTIKTNFDLQRRRSDLESQRSKKRRALFAAQDEIEARKESLIAEVEARLRQSHTLSPLFTIRWVVVLLKEIRRAC